MTPEQQNQAIAEACGIVQRDQWGPLYKTASGYFRDCPAYHSDLNACAEFEATISQASVAKYNHVLQSIRLDAPPSNPASDHAWHATAPQRCEAFLRTLGLWRE